MSFLTTRDGGRGERRLFVQERRERPRPVPGHVPRRGAGEVQMLEIAYHPDSNPKNMKQMDVVLEAELK
jgi:hypothetical protein